MTLKQPFFWYILILFIFGTLHKALKSQDGNEINYDRIKDTLVIINDKMIDQNKVLMERQEFRMDDTIKINQKDLSISSFKMSAITLGQDITLNSSSAFFTNEMINEIINGEAKYKFIYLKDIILRSKDGRFITPSTKSIKIIFSN